MDFFVIPPPTLYNNSVDDKSAELFASTISAVSQIPRIHADLAYIDDNDEFGGISVQLWSWKEREWLSLLSKQGDSLEELELNLSKSIANAVLVGSEADLDFDAMLRGSSSSSSEDNGEDKRKRIAIHIGHISSGFDEKFQSRIMLQRKGRFHLWLDVSAKQMDSSSPKVTFSNPNDANAPWFAKAGFLHLSFENDAFEELERFLVSLLARKYSLTSITCLDIPMKAS